MIEVNGTRHPRPSMSRSTDDMRSHLNAPDDTPASVFVVIHGDAVQMMFGDEFEVIMSDSVEDALNDSGGDLPDMDNGMYEPDGLSVGVSGGAAVFVIPAGQVTPCRVNLKGQVTSEGITVKAYYTTDIFSHKLHPCVMWEGGLQLTESVTPWGPVWKAEEEAYAENARRDA